MNITQYLMLGIALGVPTWLAYRHFVCRGTATRAVDGDGFTLLRRGLPAVRIRVAWIDAPEKGQPFFDYSKGALWALLQHQEIRVRFIETDVNGRKVAQVFADGKDVGLQMVTTGAAWYYRHYAKTQSWWARLKYGAAERKARQMRLGLWKESKPQAPWDYKHRPLWKKLFFKA